MHMQCQGCVTGKAAMRDRNLAALEGVEYNMDSQCPKIRPNSMTEDPFGPPPELEQF